MWQLRWLSLILLETLVICCPFDTSAHRVFRQTFQKSSVWVLLVTCNRNPFVTGWRMEEDFDIVFSYNKRAWEYGWAQRLRWTSPLSFPFQFGLSHSAHGFLHVIRGRRAYAQIVPGLHHLSLRGWKENVLSCWCFLTGGVGAFGPIFNWNRTQVLFVLT